MSDQTRSEEASSSVATENSDGDDKASQGQTTKRFKEERKNISTWQMCVKKNRKSWHMWPWK